MIYWIKVRELWVVCARITSFFSFPTHTRAHFPHKLQKDYKTFSMWLQNKDKTETYNALCNFSESPHMCRSSNHMAWCIMRLVYFAHIYMACVLRLLVSVAYQAVLYSLGLHGRWGSEGVSVFDGFVFISVDVKYIIHYRCMCKFICSL